MSNKLIFWTGILGVSLFTIAAVLGGFLIENYNPVAQLISESYAIDTAYGTFLRCCFYIPSGLLIALFCFAAVKKLPKSNLIKIGFNGLAIFYGIATVIVSIFPCDKGCNKEFIDPSISQIIHNLTGLLTYLLVPICLLSIGIGLRQLNNYNQLSKTALVCGFTSIGFIGILFANPMSNYAGLFQRIIEGTFIVWIIASAFWIKQNNEIGNI